MSEDDMTPAEVFVGIPRDVRLAAAAMAEATERAKEIDLPRAVLDDLGEAGRRVRFAVQSMSIEGKRRGLKP